jgi:hypothetical protein
MSSMKLMLALDDVGGGAGVVVVLRVETCVGDEVCAVFILGFPSRGLQVRAVKFEWSSCGVQVEVCRSGCCGFLGFYSLVE